MAWDGGSSNEEVVFRRLGGLLLSLPHGVKSSAIVDARNEDQEGEEEEGCERRLSAGCNLSCRIRFKIIDPRGWWREWRVVTFEPVMAPGSNWPRGK